MSGLIRDDWMNDLWPLAPPNLVGWPINWWSQPQSEPWKFSLHLPHPPWKPHLESVKINWWINAKMTAKFWTPVRIQRPRQISVQAPRKATRSRLCFSPFQFVGFVDWNFCCLLLLLFCSNEWYYHSISEVTAQWCLCDLLGHWIIQWITSTSFNWPVTNSGHFWGSGDSSSFF